MTADGDLDRAYVNDGGDIALHLTPGTEITAAIAARAGFPDRALVRHPDPVRGVATSGWRGRSFSLGIADAVTVLAPTAAQADAAATMIANAVDLPGHPAITRRPARDLQHDTDLGDRPVTTAVGPLDPGRGRRRPRRRRRLRRGDARAAAHRRRGAFPRRRMPYRRPSAGCDRRGLGGRTTVRLSHAAVISGLS